MEATKPAAVSTAETIEWANGLVSRKTCLPVYGTKGMRAARAIPKDYLFAVSRITALEDGIGFYAACFDQEKAFLGWLGDRNKPHTNLSVIALAPRGTVYCMPVAFYLDDRPVDPASISAGIRILQLPAEEFLQFDPVRYARDSYLRTIDAGCAYPASVAEACRLLGAPLPEHAALPALPSAYIDLSALFSEAGAGKLRKRLEKNGVTVPRSYFADNYSSFLSRFRQQAPDGANETDFLVWFTDWKLFTRPRGFNIENYFAFELYARTPDERDTFLNIGFMESVKRLCTPWAQAKRVADKLSFNRLFPSFVSREWLDTASCTPEEFTGFLSRHPVFFVKPKDGTRGAGATLLRADEDTPDNLLRRCSESGMIAEELIIQHPALAALNPGSVNTARVYTLFCADDVPRIMMATVRTGRDGVVVDNFHSGGIGARLDPVTGAAVSDGIDGLGRTYPVHPDTGQPFRKFAFPNWEAVRAAVLEAAAQVPGVRNIGWDVTVTASGSVEFVEGNTSPGVILPQAGCREGARGLYEPYLKQIAAQQGIRFPEEEEWFLP